MPQPLLAEYVVIINIFFFFCLRSHEKNTVSFAAGGAGSNSMVVHFTET